MQWLLPEYFADILPPEAKRLESLRRKVLDLFASYGFELVMPPLIEYLDSLLTGSARDLDLKTFKLVDQLSGKMMGLRADITPQIVRIDSQLLNDDGITRLCYCGVVAHTRPSNLKSGRELQQIGAEIYGASHIDADLAIITLAVKALNACAITIDRIDLNHFGIFNALCEMAKIDESLKLQLAKFLRLKDAPALFAATDDFAPTNKNVFRALLNLYGDSIDVLSRAHAAFDVLKNPTINAALTDLAWIIQKRPDLPFSIDLADLVGYYYHTALAFNAFNVNYPNALAHGGRYDGVGKVFKRARAATGFSMDLRQLVLVAPELKDSESAENAPIFVEKTEDSTALQALTKILKDWRLQNRVVVEALTDEKIPKNAKRLAWNNGKWQFKNGGEHG